MKNLIKHLKVVHNHRKYVRRMCWKLGLFWQGLTHDLSKYSITELKIAKYYGGNRSPHAVCRDKLGYSPSWMHHYHINKHHWQFWLDMEDWPDRIIPVKMPYKYVIEMLCDMAGASKAYNPKNWEPKMLWDYWVTKCKGKRLMHPDSEYLIEKLIWNYYQYGEKAFIKVYKEQKPYLIKAYNGSYIRDEMAINY